MRTNLSSQISLNRVSPKYYKPENAVERSVLTRCEKVPTDIYETMEEGVQHIANEITAKIQERQREGKFCVIGAGTGASLRPLYAELVRKHKDEGLSFRNVVIFNLYEYYPLASEGAGSSFSQLNDLFQAKSTSINKMYSPSTERFRRKLSSNTVACTNNVSRLLAV